MSVAIIAEDFAGMRAQACGLAERAALPWHFHPVYVKGLWRRVPSRFCPWPLKAMDSFDLPSDTSLLMSVGGTGGVAGAALRRKTGLPLVQIQNPRMAFSRFDLIVANCHDDIRGDNVVLSRNAMHAVTPEVLARAREVWWPRLRQDARPLLSVLIGGGNGRFSFDAVRAAGLAEDLRAVAVDSGVHIALTPSRRTDPAALEVLKRGLEPLGAMIWDGKGDNPYYGMLACADMIAVTTDSVSMISEAVATNAPVRIISLPGRSRRIASFVRTLEEAGRVRPFISRWETWSVSMLDDTGRAAEEMRRRLML